jgi:CheY-like chemotaxis protein
MDRTFGSPRVTLTINCCACGNLGVASPATSLRLVCIRSQPESRYLIGTDRAAWECKFVDHKNSNSLRTILLVDDGHDTRILTKWFLNNFGFTVDSTRSAEEALARFDPQVHDLVVTDNSMPGLSGAELAHVIKLRSPTTPVIMFSGNPPSDHSCLDLVLQRPAHLMLLKEGIDQILASPTLPTHAMGDLH